MRRLHKDCSSFFAHPDTYLGYVLINYYYLAYFPKVGLCDLHASCVSVNPPH
jgi:hypothetical protein